MGTDPKRPAGIREPPTAWAGMREIMWANRLIITRRITGYKASVFLRQNKAGKAVTVGSLERKGRACSLRAWRVETKREIRGHGRTLRSSPCRTASCKL